jgi:hypothetical protein
MSRFSKAEIEVIEEQRRESKKADTTKSPQGGIPKGGPPNPIKEWEKTKGLR